MLRGVLGVVRGRAVRLERADDASAVAVEEVGRGHRVERARVRHVRAHRERVVGARAQVERGHDELRALLLDVPHHVAVLVALLLGLLPLAVEGALDEDRREPRRGVVGHEARAVEHAPGDPGRDVRGARRHRDGVGAREEVPRVRREDAGDGHPRAAARRPHQIARAARLDPVEALRYE